MKAKKKILVVKIMKRRFGNGHVVYDKVSSKDSREIQEFQDQKKKKKMGQMLGWLHLRLCYKEIHSTFMLK